MRRLSALFFFAFLFSSAVVLAEEAKMRPAVKVDLILDQQNNYLVELPASPYIYKDQVNLIPEEKLFVEAEERDGRLINLRLVDKVTKPDSTLELAFSQNQDRTDPFMFLTIKNPFSKTLDYRAKAHRAGNNKFVSTDVLPVEPRTTNYESWPYPIVRIALFDFTLK